MPSDGRGADCERASVKPGRMSNAPGFSERTPRNFGVHFFALRRRARHRVKAVSRTSQQTNGGETVNVLRRFITEPGDRQWLHATPRTAAAGGTLVALVLAAMVVLQPSERPNGDANRASRSAASTSSSASNVPAAPVGALVPESSPPALLREASTEASQQPRADRVGHDRWPR